MVSSIMLLCTILVQIRISNVLLFVLLLPPVCAPPPSYPLRPVSLPGSGVPPPVINACLILPSVAVGPTRRTACWAKSGPPVLSAQCPRATLLQVVRAGLRVAKGVAGGACRYDGADCGCDYGDAGCEMPDVRAACMGRDHCTLAVVQQYVHTNTCRGFTTYMFLEFNCLPGEPS